MKAVVMAFTLGFIGAILFAPKSGHDLREDFWQRINDMEKELDKELDRRGLN